ncbi:unnamed protein product [Choristocarpus tenellus]
MYGLPQHLCRYAFVVAAIFGRLALCVYPISYTFFCHCDVIHTLFLAWHQVLRKLIRKKDALVVFAGDTNLREAEIKSEALAKEVGDMWKLCGSDPEVRFTWDLLKNDNKDFGSFKPRARYDRVFTSPTASEGALSFDLLGRERMAPESCFPSDHFGVDCIFTW